MWSLGGFSVALGTSTTVGKARFDFARTTTNVAAAVASFTALLQVPSGIPTTDFLPVRGRSLAVALGTQCSLRHLLNSATAALSMDGRVDDQDHDDGAEDNHPVGNLDARYRRLLARTTPFRPPIFKSDRAKHRRKVRGPSSVSLSFFYWRRPNPPVCRPHLDPLVGLSGDPPADDAAARKRHGVRTCSSTTAISSSPVYGAVDIGFQST